MTAPSGHIFVLILTPPLHAIQPSLPFSPSPIFAQSHGLLPAACLSVCLIFISLSLFTSVTYPFSYNTPSHSVYTYYQSCIIIIGRSLRFSGPGPGSGSRDCSTLNASLVVCVFGFGFGCACVSVALPALDRCSLARSLVRSFVARHAAIRRPQPRRTVAPAAQVI